MAEIKQNIKIIENAPYCSTFEIEDEDHTLGNALRYMLIKDPSVKFCGYSMPHPNERRIVMQVQTIENTTSPLEAFKKALSNLMEMFGHVKQTFEDAYDQDSVRIKEEPDSDMD